jgi:predicted aspartyl protease
MVPTLIRAPLGVDTATLEGKLDTGADLSAVPERFIAELDVPPVRTVRAATFLGELQEVIVYRIDIKIGTMSFERIEVLSTRRPYVILGRNILRLLVVRLDGPGESVELRLPRS